MRVGTGYDIHPLVTGRRLVLGGVEIPFEKGLAGHSDADCLFHAVGDALLGALGVGDMGTHFPDNDPAHRDRSSSFFLSEIMKWIDKEGYRVGNVDITVILEKPHLGPYKEKMIANLARLLGVGPRQVNVKAKRNEGMDALGQGQGIAAQAVVLLERR